MMEGFRMVPSGAGLEFCEWIEQAGDFESGKFTD